MSGSLQWPTIVVQTPHYGVSRSSSKTQAGRGGVKLWTWEEEGDRTPQNHARDRCPLGHRGALTERPKNPNHTLLEETNRLGATRWARAILTNPRGEVALSPDGDYNARDDGVTARLTLEGIARSALDPVSPQDKKQRAKEREGPSPRAGEALV